jgi:hypothetical protein
MTIKQRLEDIDETEPQLLLAIRIVADWYFDLPNDELPEDQRLRSAFGFLNRLIGVPEK